MSEEVLASLIFLLLGIIGMIINIICIVKLLKMVEMQNMFGYICLSHSISNLGVCTIYVFWTPLIILVLPETKFTYTLNIRIGQLGMFFWYISIYCHILVCINRFIAIYLPLQYNKCFSNFNTKVFLLFLWCIPIIHVIPYFFPKCDYYFDSTSYIFTFSASKCSEMLGTIIDFHLTIAYVTFTIFVDFLICVKLFIRYKKALRDNEIKMLKKKATISPAGGNKTFFRFTSMKRTVNPSQHREGITSNGSNSKATMKTKFFFQAFCQNLIFLLEILSFYVFSSYFTSKLCIMAFTSCAWELCHLLDGLCLMMFNGEIRKTITKCSF
uniref:G_PROTEIN_RECEP_F1_2 domain-containing protein n=1 Tax=Parastrongyloides trichosuri TaxID=131310 RepID=A0A0N4Z9T7_PARTI